MTRFTVSLACSVSFETLHFFFYSRFPCSAIKSRWFSVKVRVITGRQVCKVYETQDRWWRMVYRRQGAKSTPWGIIGQRAKKKKMCKIIRAGREKVSQLINRETCQATETIDSGLRMPSRQFFHTLSYIPILMVSTCLFALVHLRRICLRPSVGRM